MLFIPHNELGSRNYYPHVLDAVTIYERESNLPEATEAPGGREDKPQPL